MDTTSNNLADLSPLAKRSLELEMRRLHDLKLRDGNPRTHSKKQIRQLAASIKRFGFTNPIIIDDCDQVIAGSGRVQAARHLGLREVPTIRLSGMTEAQIRAYVIADNRLAELAGWDQELLAVEFQYLLEFDTEFDLTITGFELPEIDMIIEDGTSAHIGDADSVVIPDHSAPAISALGDFWELGRHRQLCGDATSWADYELLMAGSVARIVFTDPPYNVPIDGNVCGLGSVRHREFPMASGEMSELEFANFLERVLCNLVTFSSDSSIHFICMDWRHVCCLTTVGAGIYSELKNICVWDKGRGGMGSLYRSQYELVLVFKNGTAPHTNNVELGRHGRNRTNVWQYLPARIGGEADLSVHPTAKPVSMVADALRDCSNRGDIVLDPLSGSGTTIMAAEKVGRRACAMELDPLYVDATIRRWQAYTGGQAVLAGTGLPFEAVAAMRELQTPSNKEADHVR